MAQWINITGTLTGSLQEGPGTLYAVINNSGSANIKLYDGVVNPLAPNDGRFTASFAGGEAHQICNLQFNAQPIKIDYGVRVNNGLLIQAGSGDVTVIYG